MDLLFISIAFWSRYIENYVSNGLYKSSRVFASRIPKAELIEILPDYPAAASRDSIPIDYSSFHVDAREYHSLEILTEVLSIAKEDTDVYTSLCHSMSLVVSLS